MCVGAHGRSSEDFVGAAFELVAQNSQLLSHALLRTTDHLSVRSACHLQAVQRDGVLMKRDYWLLVSCTSCNGSAFVARVREMCSLHVPGCGAVVRLWCDQCRSLSGVHAGDDGMIRMPKRVRSKRLLVRLLIRVVSVMQLLSPVGGHRCPFGVSVQLVGELIHL